MVRHASEELLNQDPDLRAHSEWLRLAGHSQCAECFLQGLARHEELNAFEDTSDVKNLNFTKAKTK